MVHQSISKLRTLFHNRESIISNQAMLPQYLNLLPSYLCNARCKICHIWQKNPESKQRQAEEMSISFYRKLFADPWLRDLRHLSISGGEPFLYPHLIELIKLVPKSVVISIATNAIPLSQIMPTLPQLASLISNNRKIILQISLDGTEPIHNQLRGIPIAYQNALEVITALQSYSIPFYFSMVLTTVNANQIDHIYSLAKKYDTVVQVNPIHPGDYYAEPELKELSNWTEKQITLVEEQLKRMLAELIPQNKLAPEEIEFYQHIPEYLRHGELEVPECYAGRIAVYLDPYGTIYPCPVYWKPMGNIRENSPLVVWNSDQANQVRQEIANLACHGCWHICQVPLNLRLRNSKSQTPK